MTNIDEPSASAPRATTPDDMLTDLQHELTTTFGCLVTKVFFGGPAPAEITVERAAEAIAHDPATAPEESLR